MTVCLNISAIEKTITIPDQEVRRLAAMVRPVIETPDGPYYVAQRNPVLQTYTQGILKEKANNIGPAATFLTRHEKADLLPDFFRPSLAEPFSQIPLEMLEGASAISTIMIGLTVYAEQQVGATTLYKPNPSKALAKLSSKILAPPLQEPL